MYAQIIVQNLQGNLDKLYCFFFFNDTPTTEIYTLSLHAALPICPVSTAFSSAGPAQAHRSRRWRAPARVRDRKSTRLNSSHGYISYAVFCLTKKISKAVYELH